MPRKIHSTSMPEAPPHWNLRHAPGMNLHTTSVTFALWWLILFLLHGVNVAYYAGAAMAYRVILGTNVAFELGNYSITIDPLEYTKVSTVHYIVAILHVLIMVAMLVGSLQARRLVFWPSPPRWMAKGWTRIRRAATIIMNYVVPCGNQQRNNANEWSRRISTATTLSSYVFSREGPLGVDYVYFDHLHLAREFVETILQLIQAYRMTYLLPRLWLIRFYVVLLIVNCWSTPFLHRYYHNRHVDRRFMSLLCDAILDTMSSIGVSSIIFATYAPQYNDPDFGFPFGDWYDDVWFTNMQQEFQMMMVVSWADLASRLVFAAGLLQCMESIKDFLTPIERPEPRETIKSSAVSPVQALIETTRPPTVSSSLKAKLLWLIHFLLEKVGPAFFITLGFGILIVHGIAETRVQSAIIPCRLPLHPWFVQKPACSLVELDCHLLEVSGSQDSLANAWSAFESSTTAWVFIRHCPQLEMPTKLQRFHFISAMKLYNCTIVSWEDTAALTATLHPKIRGLFFVRTMFPDGILPPGLITMDFPPRLANFLTSATNLQTLPDHLDESWPPGMTLAFERSLMDVVPSVLIKLNVAFVSLAGSPITTVPAELFEGSLLCCVVLIGTRVQELPRIVPNPSPELFLLYVDDTNISTFWSWMEPIFAYDSTLIESFVAAHGTPYCTQRDEIVAGNRTNFITDDLTIEDLASIMDVSTPANLAYSISAVTCRATIFFFPLELQDASTAIHQ